MNQQRFSFALIATLLALAGCDDTTETGTDASTPAVDGGAPMTNTIVDIAAADPDFSMLVSAVGRAGLVDVLASPGPFTVFAPTNQAFMDSGITQDAIDTMPVDQLTAILTYHAVAGAVLSTDLENGTVTPVAEFTLFVGVDGGVTLNGGNSVTGGAGVVTADIAADNGVIHVIDRVLLPPTVADLARYGGLDSLVAAVGAAAPLPDGTSVLDALNAPDATYTVFAPTNAAFDALAATPDADQLRDVLLYHVLGATVRSSAIPGQADTLLTNAWGNGVTVLFDTSAGATINGASIAVTDLAGTNGVVHVIESVLLPPNAIDMAGIAGLGELATAIGAAADLAPGTPVADALVSEGPFTIFAPTNAAFEAVASVTATLDAEALRDVLLFHVAPADPPVLSGALADGEVPTLFTDTLTIDTSSTPPSVEEASVMMVDINVTNGVIHVIDAVMIPPSFGG